ncbi:outer membrane beta-barrel protein [Primorskyibacter aestuariivivens]|uniref:outer membrane protein n=1 Tax=Primorskyibacter aestuariivivens TaxID=1888912 RepID=UPI002300F40D|nr:outer membrane beta-barrel protein [Primorskyibacter aestuariivivens]MDA7426983.1 outer membrane beta-barrel protein [Primorskyibacter aestuariivivens]
MKLLSTTAIAAIAMTTGNIALAANYDPAPAATPVVQAPIADWNGPYGGLVLSHSTGVFGNDTNFPGDGEGSLEGGAAGIVLGYNFQSNNMVFGAELNYNWSDIAGAEECVNPAFDCGVNIDSFGSIRARAGYLISPKSLIYATLGAANADIYAYTDGPIGENGETRSVGGLLYGVGFEQMVTQNWNFRAAVIRHDFDEQDFDTDVTYTDVNVDFTTIEFGVTFNF